MGGFTQFLKIFPLYWLLQVVEVGLQSGKKTGKKEVYFFVAEHVCP